MTDQQPTTEPTDEELYRMAAGHDGYAQVAGCRAIYQAGVASQAARIAELEERVARLVGDGYEAMRAERDTLTQQIAELEGELSAEKTRANDYYDALGRESRAAHEARKERDTLTRELAEAREELRRKSSDYDCLAATHEAVCQALDAHRSAKTSAGEGARDDGPPRVGDVVKVYDVWKESTMLSACPIGSEQVISAVLSERPINAPGFTLYEFAGVGAVACCVVVVRRAGQPEAQTGDLAAKTGGLAEKTGGLPGGIDPNAATIAELVRRVGQLEAEVRLPKGDDTVVWAAKIPTTTIAWEIRHIVTWPGNEWPREYLYPSVVRVEPEKCERCDGVGYPLDDPNECPDCKGTGENPDH